MRPGIVVEPDAVLLNGEEILLEGWHASFAPGGCARAGGDVEASVARRLEQGDELVFMVAGEAKWGGKVSRESLALRGRGVLQASGYHAKAQRATGELLYQSRGTQGWFDRTGPPLNNLESAVLSMSIEDGAIVWSENQGAAAGTNDHRSAAFWTKSPGGVTRLAFRHKSSASGVGSRQYEVYRTESFPVDSGYALVGAAFGESATEQSRDTNAISPSQAGMLIQRKYVGGAGTYSEARAHAYDIKVYGIAPDDEFFTSDVVRDIGGRLGFDTSGVQSSGVNALPFWLVTGTWFEAGFLYMAFLDDWAPPGVYPRLRRNLGPLLRYAPWGDTVHTVYLGEDAEPDLNSLGRANGVIVSFRHAGGFDDEVTIRPSDIGVADPLAGKDADDFIPIRLRDVQPDNTLPTAVGKNLLSRVVGRRWDGVVEVAHVPDATVWDLHNGQHLRAANFAPLAAQELPIDSVELRQGQVARVNIYSPGHELGLADRVGLERARTLAHPELNLDAVYAAMAAAAEEAAANAAAAMEASAELDIPKALRPGFPWPGQAGAKSKPPQPTGKDVGKGGGKKKQHKWWQTPGSGR